MYLILFSHWSSFPPFLSLLFSFFISHPFAQVSRSPGYLVHQSHLELLILLHLSWVLGWWIHHYTWFLGSRGLNPGLGACYLNTYQPSHISRPKNSLSSQIIYITFSPKQHPQPHVISECHDVRLCVCPPIASRFLESSHSCLLLCVISVFRYQVGDSADEGMQIVWSRATRLSRNDRSETSRESHCYHPRIKLAILSNIYKGFRLLDSVHYR